MTLIPGNNIDIILQHENVNSGVGFGFVLAELEVIVPEVIGEALGKNISQTRTLSESTKRGWLREQDIVHFFSIGLGVHQVEPSGARRTETELGDLNNLLEILSEIFEITLITKNGAYSGLRADGHSLTLVQYDIYSIAAVRLLTTSKNFKAADLDLWRLSIVVDEDAAPDPTGQVYDETSPTIKGYVR